MNELREKKILRLIISASSFFFFSSCLFSSFGSELLVPGSNLRSAIPQYPSTQKIEIEPDVLEQIVIDLPGEDYLQYVSQTKISWTEDTIADVLVMYGETLTDDNWKNISDWEARYRYLRSEWVKEDLSLSLMLLYDLDSESIGLLNNSYGIVGLEPGGVLIISRLVDLSKPSQ